MDNQKVARELLKVASSLSLIGSPPYRKRTKVENAGDEETSRVYRQEAEQITERMYQWYRKIDFTAIEQIAYQAKMLGVNADGMKWRTLKKKAEDIQKKCDEVRTILFTVGKEVRNLGPKNMK